MLLLGPREMDHGMSQLCKAIADIEVMNSMPSEEHERHAELLSESRRAIEAPRGRITQGDVQPEEIVAVKG
jgi:hypothetical protein